MTYKQIVKEISEKVGLPYTTVDKTYKSYWKVIREYIEALPLKEDLTEEEFLQLRPNVNIPSIGKLYVDLSRYLKVKKRDNLLKKFYIKGTKRHARNNKD